MVKPTLFISHASQDGALAKACKNEIENVFANGIEVFCTSSPDVIQAGEDWLQRIEDNLRTAQAVIVLVTPVSVEKPWLWFEIGATWLKGRTGDCRIYPICASEIGVGSLPSPLNRLQAISLNDPSDLKQLFQRLIQQFGFGEISTFRADRISLHIPDYNKLQLANADQQKRLLTASTPDVRVTANSGFTPAIGGPKYLLAIEAQNHSPVDVYINSIYLEAKDGSILVAESDFPSGEHWIPKELHPGKSVMFRFRPSSIKGYLSKGLVCAAARDQIGRVFRSTEKEFAEALRVLFDYYLKPEEQSRT